MPGTPPLEGRRVAPAPPPPEDLPTVRRWYRDPELARLTRYSLRPMTDDEVDRFFHARLLSPSRWPTPSTCGTSDRLIGLTTFSNLDPDNGSVLFHITIGEPDAWGRGLRHGGDRAHAPAGLRAHRPPSRGAVGVRFNERAIRSYQKAGFRLEGRAREAIARDGERFDELTMGVLADEWLATHAGVAA